MYVLRQEIHHTPPSSFHASNTLHPSSKPDDVAGVGLAGRILTALCGHLFNDGLFASSPALSDLTIPIHRTTSAHPSSSVHNALPASKIAFVSHETQPIPKFADMTLTLHDGLTGTRAAVVDDAGPTLPEIPIDVFCQHILPRPKIIDHLDDVLDALEKIPGRWGAYNRKTQRWRVFPKNPRDAGLVENTVFGKLKVVADAIALAARQFDGGQKPTTRFDQDPNRAPDADWRTTGVKPDGYFVLNEPRSPGDKAHWMDVVATGEYKRDDRDLRHLEDDSKKVLYNMSHTLREDPCRRFTFGFTIENCNMRLWYSSRADIYVSTPFDIMTSHKYLVQFFLALFYAEQHELGWDPTIEYCPAVGECGAFYIYTVYSTNERGEVEATRFKTLECLSNLGAQALRGRGTRVWKVRKWADNQEIGEPMVLKDCWIDCDRQREGDIMEAILARAKGTEHEVVLRRALLTTVMHGDVYIGDAIDQTIDAEERKQITRADQWIVFHRTEIKLKKFEALCAGRSQANVAATRGHRSLYDAIKSEPELKPITYTPKKHYRIVFRELCTTLHREPYLVNVLSSLITLCGILRSLHAIGWVHRDISSGNVLVSDGVIPVVKLADFEYAKEIGASTGGNHEIRTGTVDFMSVEVAAMDYTFTFTGDDASRMKPVGPRDMFGDDAWTVNNLDMRKGGSAKMHGTTRQWFYNPIHDMESVIWLLFYFTLHRDVYLTPIFPRFSKDYTLGASSADLALLRPPQHLQDHGMSRVERIKAQYHLTRDMFVTRSARLATINQNSRLENYFGAHQLHPALRCSVVCQDTEQETHISRLIVEARDMIKRFYQKLEKDIALIPDKRHGFADGLHEALGRIIHDVRRCVLCVKEEDWNICLRPLSDEYWKIPREQRLAGVVNLRDSGSTPSTGSKRRLEDISEEPEGTADAPVAPAKKPRAAANRKKAPTKAAAAGPSRAVPPAAKKPARPAPGTRRKRANANEADEVPKSPRKAARRRKEELSVHDVDVDDYSPENVQTRGTRRTKRGAQPSRPPSTRTLRPRALPAELPAPRPSRTRAVAAITPTSRVQTRQNDKPPVPRAGGRTLRPRK